jgi:prepilin-type N-terminal cleavage/methylation domain-containing protein
MGPSRHSAGFTLIELMVVVSIVGISLMAFIPSFSHSMADRRAATATMELVRLARRARAESIGLQRAFLVNVDYGLAPLQTARMVVLRGNSRLCDIEDWTIPNAVCPVNNDLERSATACLESINLAGSHWYKNPFIITVGMYNAGETPTAPTPNQVVQEVATGGRRGTVSVCYEPSGIVRWTTSGLADGSLMNFSTLNQGAAAGGGLMFAVGLVDGTTRELINVPRVALFPLAAPPRRMR